MLPPESFNLARELHALLPFRSKRRLLARLLFSLPTNGVARTDRLPPL
jgi:hypothetical protein